VQAIMNKLPRESVLLEQARRGEVGAFQVLYETNAMWVYSLCRKITCSEAQAEDLTIDAFMGAFRNLSRIRQDSDFVSGLRDSTARVLSRYFAEWTDDRAVRHAPEIPFALN
jgi:DNA-directed RNA polymerase specialized sigma24 family protein